MRIQLADGTGLLISAHARVRYQERVCPTLDARQAREHLTRLALQTGRLEAFPDWVWLEKLDSSRCVTLGPDICLVVRGRDLVVTCVARGGLTPALEQRRSRRRRSRRTAKRYKQPQGRAERRMARSVRRTQRAPGIDEAA